MFYISVILPFKHVYIKSLKDSRKNKYTNERIITSPIAQFFNDFYPEVFICGKILPMRKIYERLLLLVFNEFLQILNGNQFLARHEYPHKAE